jgi:ATP-binding cassette subfamily B (MDR/TAP) protein 6
VEGVLQGLEFESRHPTIEEMEEYPPYIHCSPRVRKIRWIASSIVVAMVILEVLSSLNKFRFREDPWTLISSVMLLLAWISVSSVYTAELRGFGVKKSLIPAFWILALLLDAVTLFNFMTHLSSIFSLVIFLFRALAEAVLVSTLAANQPDGYVQIEEQPEKKKDIWGQLPKLLPFLWPSNDLKLQILVFAAFSMLVVGRLVNVLLPLAYKGIIDSLTGSGQLPFPWHRILLFVFLRMLQGGSSGILSNLESLLWIKPSQYSSRTINVAMIQHLLNLSMEWHLNRKTGEVLQITARGSSSISSLLESIFFFVLPVLVDISIAIVFFVMQFSWEFGVIVFATIVVYVAVTVLLTEWRTKFRRQSNEKDNAVKARVTDVLLNYETTKTFSGEAYEVKRYTDAIVDYQKNDWLVQASLGLLNIAQGLAINLGLLAGCLLSGYQVSKGRATIGSFVLFLSYILQLYEPLNWLGTYYRMIQSNLIDFEQLFQLLKEPVTIVDDPEAKPLVIKAGKIEFQNVTFGYGKGHNILKKVSFSCEPGKTVALVGPTGSGKSTITRLLFRFYDPTEGAILIDGQDLRNVTQSSLRKAIGLVPQDTNLWHSSIRENIRYGRLADEFQPSGTDEQVEEAARNAELLSSIEGFPAGFDTMVGERGLKLSGGQRQRVALSRIFMKNPPILVLDEATSSLDQQTEKKVTDTLDRLAAGRTTLVIAHRLQSIVHSDLIIVLANGVIVDQGSHDELLQVAKERMGRSEAPGVYYDLWTAQEAEQAEEGEISPQS